MNPALTVLTFAARLYCLGVLAGIAWLVWNTLRAEAGSRQDWWSE